MRPSPRMITRGLAALAAVSLGACFDFDATTAGGPLGGDGGPSFPPGAGSDAGVLDASVPPGPVDGDAPVPDGTIADAGADVGSGKLPDGGSSYCATLTPPPGAVFFCDDFDEHPLPWAWQYYDELAGTLVESEAGARSAPNSVDETTTALANGQVIDVALRTPLQLPPLPATLRFGFSLEPVQIDTTANAAIVLGAVDFLDGTGNRYSVGLAINVVGGKPALALGEQSGLVDGGPLPDGAPPQFVNHPLPPTQPLAMNAWSDIVIELDWTATTLEGKVSVNGGQELDVPLNLSLQANALQIGIGTSYVTEYSTGPAPIWELRYDNVSFTGK